MWKPIKSSVYLSIMAFQSISDNDLATFLNVRKILTEHITIVYLRCHDIPINILLIFS